MELLQILLLQWHNQRFFYLAICFTPKLWATKITIGKKRENPKVVANQRSVVEPWEPRRWGPTHNHRHHNGAHVKIGWRPPRPLPHVRVIRWWLNLSGEVCRVSRLLHVIVSLPSPTRVPSSSSPVVTTFVCTNFTSLLLDGCWFCHVHAGLQVTHCNNNWDLEEDCANIVRFSMGGKLLPRILVLESPTFTSLLKLCMLRQPQAKII